MNIHNNKIKLAIQQLHNKYNLSFINNNLYYNETLKYYKNS